MLHVIVAYADLPMTQSSSTVTLTVFAEEHEAPNADKMELCRAYPNQYYGEQWKEMTAAGKESVTLHKQCL